MATRFYFQAGTTPTVSPAFSVAWNSTTGMTRLKMDTTKASTAFTDYTTTSNPFGGGYTGIVQLISRPLNGAQDITASTIQPPILRVKNNSGLADKEVAYLVRVCTNDGSSYRGTAYAFTYNNGDDFGASYSSRVPAIDSMSLVSASDGDRIVIEIGIRNNTDGASSNSFEIGDNAASDLGTTAGETNQYNPWFEMSALTLSFQSEGGSNFTQTVSNSINTFGGGPSTKWNSFSWGAANWGDGTNDLQTDVEKPLSESMSMSDAIGLSVAFSRSFSHSLDSTFEATNGTVTDASGYYRLFSGGVTNADDRSEVTYSQGTEAGTSWSSGTAQSTSWSDA